MERKPNFNNDNIIGKIGEDYIKNFLKEKKLSFEDVSNDIFFQKFDIDIVKLNKNGIKNNVNINEEIRKYKLNLNNKQNITFLEIKTDTFGYISRNIVFEDCCFGSPGCLSKTLSDYIIYIFIDSNNKKIYEAYSIDIYQLRNWLGLTLKDALNKSIIPFFNKKNNHIVYKKINNFFDNSYKQVIQYKQKINDEFENAPFKNVFMYLIDVDFMVYFGLAKKFTSNI